MTGVESSFHILFDKSCGDLVCGTVGEVYIVGVANKFDHYFHFDNELGEGWHSICAVSIGWRQFMNIGYAEQNSEF